MSVARFPQIVLVGARDRDLDAMLQAAGVRAKAVAASELGVMAHPTARPPQLVIVDLRGLPQLPAGLALLRRHHPSTAVMLICGVLDPAVMLEAMRAGITECLAEPLSIEEIRGAVERLSSAGAPAATGSVYAFIGARGGVGTTTLAVNVAAALAREAPGQALLMDLHIAQGDAAVLLGANPTFSIVDALENSHRLDEAFLRSLIVEAKGLPGILASSDRLLVGAPPADRIRSLVEFAASLYRFVVLDLPRDDYAVLDALDGVAKVVVLANQELSSVRNAARLVTMLSQRYGRNQLALALNRYDRRADITEGDIERVVGMAPTFTLPNDYRATVRAANQGKPLASQDEDKVGAAIRGIAQSLSGLGAKPEKPSTVGAGLFGRLAVRRT